MGWKESSVMHERCRPVRRPDGFVLDAMARGANISELCRRYGVSRKTGYKSLGRYQHEGPTGLYDWSRWLRHSPLATSGEMVMAVIRLRLQWPAWGPKKIEALLLRRFPPGEVPSQSTIGRILQDCGLTKTKGRGRPRRWPRHRRGPWSSRGPQRLVDGGFLRMDPFGKGLVAHQGWASLRTADHSGRVQPVCAGASGDDQHPK